jgi:hypothetical protein
MFTFENFSPVKTRIGFRLCTCFENDFSYIGFAANTKFLL